MNNGAKVRLRASFSYRRFSATKVLNANSR